MIKYNFLKSSQNVVKMYSKCIQNVVKMYIKKQLKYHKG